jgi:hypothetical protein
MNERRPKDNLGSAQPQKAIPSSVISQLPGLIYFGLLTAALSILFIVDLIFLALVPTAAYEKLFGKALQGNTHRSPDTSLTFLIISVLGFYTTTYFAWLIWRRKKNSLWPSRNDSSMTTTETKSALQSYKTSGSMESPIGHQVETGSLGMLKSVHKRNLGQMGLVWRFIMYCAIVGGAMGFLGDFFERGIHISEFKIISLMALVAGLLLWPVFRYFDAMKFEIYENGLNAYYSGKTRQLCFSDIERFSIRAFHIYSRNAYIGLTYSMEFYPKDNDKLQPIQWKSTADNPIEEFEQLNECLLRNLASKTRDEFIG